MGKIRSTLDIVMERTKGVHMTGEERDRIRHKDHADSARSWAQKYFDNKMSVSEIASRLESAGPDRPELVSLLGRELVEGVDLEGDNARVLDALQALCGINGQEFGRRIDRHRKEAESRVRARIDAMRAELARQGIKGTSVIPNAAASKSAKEAGLKAREKLIGELAGLFIDT